MMFQSYALFPHLSVWENIAFGLKREGKPKAEIEARVDEMLRLTRLVKFAKRKPHQISGGQRQRLAFVRAVISDFVVLFGDEPTGNLDEKTAADLMMVLKSCIEQEGKTAIIVSHDLKLAQHFADVIVPLTPAFDANGGMHGEVKHANIASKEGATWAHPDGHAIANPAAFFAQYLS